MFSTWLRRANGAREKSATKPNRKSQFTPRLEALEDRLLLRGGFSVPLPQVQFSAVGYTAAENANDATIVVTRTGTLTGRVLVNYATSDGTGHAGVNYGATAGTLIFLPGQTSQSFHVRILNDGLVNGDQTVNLSLSTPSGGTLGSHSTSVLTITETSAQAQFSAANYTVAGNAGFATIVLTRSGDTGGTSTIYFSTTSGGTAQPRIDYTSTMSQLTFAPGETSKTIQIPIFNTGRPGTSRTIDLLLFRPGDGLLPGPQQTAVLTVQY